MTCIGWQQIGKDNTKKIYVLSLDEDDPMVKEYKTLICIPIQGRGDKWEYIKTHEVFNAAGRG